MDRGSFGVEVVLTLYALKLNFPKNVVLLRGNHESVQMTTFFNFKEECERKYGAELYKTFIDSFYCLPLACILNKKFLALHGGISPELKTVRGRFTVARRPPRGQPHPRNPQGRSALVTCEFLNLQRHLVVRPH